MPNLKGIQPVCGQSQEDAGLLSIEAAVELAVTECIREGILSDFLSSQRAEV